MITNFEELTAKLTAKEKSVLPLLVEILETTSKQKPKKTNTIRLLLYLETRKQINISDIKLRKLMNLIRTNGILPVIGTSRGYYLTTDPVEIEKQIKSLCERANAILNAAEGLRSIKNQIINQKQN
jgi:carbamoylphosphate synthase small subunit